MYWINNSKSVFTFLILMVMTSAAFSQESTLFGIVKDAKNNSVLEGVNVVMKGGGAVSNTNALGEFSIQVPDKYPLILTFSYLGYSIQELTISEPAYLTILLEPEYRELDEVMVVSGYTVQKKSEFSGAVSKIGSEELLNRPASSFDQLLGGRAAGIEILQPTNILNNTPILRIRGINSITSGIFPLVSAIRMF